MFTLTSTSFNKDGQFQPDQLLSADFGFGCEGDNHSPQLNWTGYPRDTKSFAITCFDHSAPIVCGFWHWMVINIPVEINTLAAGNSQNITTLGEKILQIRNDFGVAGYSGPCPPPGDEPHRYELTVYALGSAELPADAATSPALTLFMIEHAKLASASLNARYARDT